ncbi:MAG: RtcB family protein [Oscillospiraceae bacterium]|nr:RtcB family protein [Oscillospiraceae bacterium]
MQIKICIMPDVHAGKGCTIGTTVTITNRVVVPGAAGVDISCGMKAVQISKRNVGSRRLDRVIRASIPAGCNIRKNCHSLSKKSIHLNFVAPKRSISTVLCAVLVHSTGAIIL